MRRASSCTVAALVLSVPLALEHTPAWADTQAGTTWTDLWQTPDQQAQHLMSAGKPAEAATRFKDERQRAYAELEAGQYANAAKHLAPFKDADSQYNRGNALARSGNLEDALSAYDQALASKPGDKDVQHNRDLVAQALQRQRQQHSGKDGNGSQGKPGGQSQQQDAGRQSSPQNQQTTAGQQSNGQSQQMNPEQNGQGRNAGNQAQQKSRQQAQNQPSAIQGNQSTEPGDERQTERQAQEAARQEVAQANAAPSGPKPQGDALQLAKQTGARQNTETHPLPPTEQSLTLEQWLRRIPDDPGELLRRKFLVEHMQKQGNSQ
jgi:Ca-activated chloride channel homolog